MRRVGSKSFMIRLSDSDSASRCRAWSCHVQFSHPIGLGPARQGLPHLADVSERKMREICAKFPISTILGMLNRILSMEYGVF